MNPTSGHSKGTTNATDSPWQISKGDAEYPSQLTAHQLSAEWTILHGIGNHDILRHPSLGLICSVQCPGSVIMKTFDAIRELRDAGVVVAGGFHSPMERECLDFLLRGRQPVIVCPAKHAPRQRISRNWRTAIDDGRLLIVSPFPEKARLTTQRLAINRNEFVAALSLAVLVPHASPQGKTEAVAEVILQSGGSLFTFDDEGNADLTSRGGIVYNVQHVKNLFNCNQQSTKKQSGASP